MLSFQYLPSLHISNCPTGRGLNRNLLHTDLPPYWLSVANNRPPILPIHMVPHDHFPSLLSFPFRFSFGSWHLHTCMFAYMPTCRHVYRSNVRNLPVEGVYFLIPSHLLANLFIFLYLFYWLAGICCMHTEYMYGFQVISIPHCIFYYFFNWYLSIVILVLL